MKASDLLYLLKRPRERRGSKARCHLLTNGSREQVADRLSALVSPFAKVSASDRWMPIGFEDQEEAQLHKAPSLLDAAICMRLRDWWLAPSSARAMTPNFDIASTCRVDGRAGLLLIEAKAHDKELLKQAMGRILEGASEDRIASHDKIGAAIREAALGLTAATGHLWSISRDTRYQMSNRFAWAWKLTECGVPVVLVYLGFVRADEMWDRGQPFAGAADWERLVLAESAALFPAETWGRRMDVNGCCFVPLIRALEISLQKGPE